MIRILLVDDDELVRTGFRLILDVEPDMTVVGEAGDGAAAMTEVNASCPDVVLMDIQMPNMDGLGATRRICVPGGPLVLILTTFDVDEYAFEAMRAGANGFLIKNTPPSDLVSAIRAVHAGNAVVAPSTTRRLLDRFRDRMAGAHDSVSAAGTLDDLTAREREVLLHVARGLTNAEIAGRLRISEGTVKIHVRGILAKLGLRGRVQAVIFAYEKGLVGS